MLTNQLEFSPSCLILLPSPLFQMRTWLHLNPWIRLSFVFRQPRCWQHEWPVYKVSSPSSSGAHTSSLLSGRSRTITKVDFRRKYFTVERISPLYLDGIFIWFILMDFNWFSLAWPVTTPIYLALPEDLHTWGTISIFTHQPANIL